jgi:hypothetical protein
MTQPTDADRAKARELAHLARSGVGGPALREAVIAQALADEREKAQAPFLALADHYRELCMQDQDGKRRALHRSVSDRIRQATA